MCHTAEHVNYNHIFNQGKEYMHTLGFKHLGALLIAALSLTSHAAVTNLDVGTPLPRFSLLKEGTHHYLRYMKSGQTNAPADIWTRTVRLENNGAQQILRVKQRWDGAGPTPTLKLLDSTFEAGTFRPIRHERISEKDGKRMVEGFEFSGNKVNGIKDLAENAHTGLVVESPEPIFNFETDIEFLQALPLADGYAASINFYHPGGPPPARYTFKVSGSATIAGPAGPVDCWVVTTDYNRANTVSTFWFAKGTQLMLRQESPMPNGNVFVKTLID
jgi:hypothetical protein